MSIHSEVNNLFKNKSGNAQLYVRARSGDTENGNEYFDMLSSGEPSAFECLTQDEQKAARKKFLLQYFTLLKARLNHFEFEYVRQLYAEGQAENVVCDNLGLSRKKFKKLLQKKLCASADEIAALVNASDWDDAEIFSRCFLSCPSEIFKDKELSTTNPKTIKGFGNLIAARNSREQRKYYMRGFTAGRYSTFHPRYKRKRYFKLSIGIKERFDALKSIIKVLSFDFFYKSFSDYENYEIDKNEALNILKAVYITNYNMVCEIITELYDLIVNDVDINELEKVR